MQLNEFIKLGEERLSPYLAKVEDYICGLEQDKTSDREDLDMVTSPPEKYVRNMLCIAVLNRLFRDEFNRTGHKLIVLPECLKNYGPDICCKIERKNHSECAHCLSDCQVNLVDESFVDNRTDLILEPDDIDLMASEWRKKHGTVGIVGVACILTLVPGFKSTLKEKHPTQGVFLNYSSCGHHWNKKNPYNTRFSLDQLAKIMDGTPPEIQMYQPSDGETYSLENQPGSVAKLYEILDELAERFVKEILPEYQKPDHDLYQTGLDLITDLVDSWSDAA